MSPLSLWHCYINVRGNFFLGTVSFLMNCSIYSLNSVPSTYTVYIILSSVILAISFLMYYIYCWGYVGQASMRTGCMCSILKLAYNYRHTVISTAYRNLVIVYAGKVCGSADLRDMYMVVMNHERSRQEEKHQKWSSSVTAVYTSL